MECNGGGVVFKLGGGWYFRVVICDWFTLWRSLTSFEHDWLLGNVTFVQSVPTTNHVAGLTQLIDTARCARGVVTRSGCR